jgi:hypothetical protein
LDFVAFGFVLVFGCGFWCGFIYFFFFYVLVFGDGGLLDFVFYWCGSSGFVFVGEWDVVPSIFRFYILFVILFF